MAAASKFTFQVPPELRRVMDDLPEVNWTAVFRDAIRRQARAADVTRRLLEEMDDPRVQEMGAALKRRIAERFWKDMHALRG